MKRQQGGFTLIELIIVIVILGILAVTAAPRFFNFATDARKSTLNGVKGALESASSLVYGKAIIAGRQTGTACLNLAGDVLATTDSACADGQFTLTNGYPGADAATLRNIAELATEEWSITGTGPLIIKPLNAPDECHVSYAASGGAGQKPVITIVNTGC
ncbi:MSHA pilin protein MshA [Alishewanella longhuensis]|uniref:MSHA pilin protein MshA n=1 Tax=Alishewanella longhuensis TaxID=1091037 RepID=A0ABQ3L062_9ALTE|nr:prepilin-type N-terminal cleavage/methylation domain-containing protein [Alishewanella longhuensis]GHG67801.1 MSHA pilin protein MshA [Alishewanella longhuensis]